MKKIVCLMAVAMLMAACGQSYEETKRITREQRREAARQDSAALKIAVVPTLDCLPLYVAQQYELYDTIAGGVRLKPFHAQMDCDEAVSKGRVEGMVTDLVRVKYLNDHGTPMRVVAKTDVYWLLIGNRNMRIRQPKQLQKKMVAMTRHSATDSLTDRVVAMGNLKPQEVFKVQINDVYVRMQMLQNNEMDALWLAEPLATAARIQRHPVIADSRKMGVQLGVVAFRDQEMQREGRAHQLELFLKAYHQACDSINKYGVKHYRKLLAQYCNVNVSVVDSLSESRQ